VTISAYMTTSQFATLLDLRFQPDRSPTRCCGSNARHRQVDRTECRMRAPARAMTRVMLYDQRDTVVRSCRQITKRSPRRVCFAHRAERPCHRADNSSATTCSFISPP
jgi:hypothetical protein